MEVEVEVDKEEEKEKTKKKRIKINLLKENFSNIAGLRKTFILRN